MFSNLFFFAQPHLAADNLDKIHDENGNNLLHIAASQGHAECLQHLTSLMGEDCLNERNIEKLTPAGLAIKVTGWGLGFPHLKSVFCVFKFLEATVLGGRERRVIYQANSKEHITCWRLLISITSCFEILRQRSDLLSNKVKLQIRQ